MSMSFCDRKHREERLTSMAPWAILIGAAEGFACPHTCSAANLGFTRSCFGLIERPTRTRFLSPKYACASNENQTSKDCYCAFGDAPSVGDRACARTREQAATRSR